MGTRRLYDPIILASNVNMEKLKKTLMLPNLSLHSVSLVSAIHHFGGIIQNYNKRSI